MLVEGSGVEADLQRLIYKGKILDDSALLSKYDVRAGHTIHLVRGRKKKATSAGSGTGAAAASAGAPPASTSAQTRNAPLPAMNFGGGGAGGFPNWRLRSRCSTILSLCRA